MNASLPPVVLTPHQQIAFDSLLDFAINSDAGAAVLEGYAGCGKTTLVGQLVDALQERGLAVVVGAPTNKAVSVLSSKIGHCDAGTIHSLLGLRAKEKGDGTVSLEAEGLPSIGSYDVAVIDECSMMSRELLAHTFRYRGPCKMLFVGDPAQLPPVGDGDESPVFRDVQLKVRLSEVVRQAADNPIIAMTMAIRRAIEEQRRVTLQEIADVIPQGAAQAGIVPGNAQTVLDIAIGEYRRNVDCRIVAYTNDQVMTYNRGVHAALHGAHAGCEFMPGERLIVQQEFRNRERERVFTSEEVVFVGAEEGDEKFGLRTWRATLRRDDGSTVLAVIPDSANQVEQRIRQQWREWHRLKRVEQQTADYEARAKIGLYVACTRASHHMAIIA